MPMQLATTSALWQRNFTNKISPTGPQCSNCRPAASSDIHPSLCYTIYPDFTGNMGIVGTPVIDTLRGVMYFVTKIVNPADGTIDNHKFKPGVFDEYNYTKTGFHQYLHAVDIKTGLDMPNSPVEIAATATGTGDGQVPAGSHNIPFEPRRQFNRAGLVLNNGILYIAFAAHCDFNPSHGWVMSFDTVTLNRTHAFITTPNDGRGGIWMSGTAPAVDASGNIYFTTGNSLNEDPNVFSGEVHSFTTLPSDPLNRGESVVKLTPTLTLSDYFTPFDYIALNDADKDFPIQVMLLPNTGGLALTGNKDDSLFVFDQANLGGFNPVKNNVKQAVFVNGFCEMHSTFAYFGGPTPFAYQYSENSPLRAYPVSSAGLGTAITNNMILGPTGGTGGFLSVSSNGGDPNTGILWAYQAINGCDANSTTCQGILHAVKASDITKELWNSDQSGVPDHIDIFNKMSCPTIALGKVYLASNFNQLRVYGLKTNSTCLTNVSSGKPAVAPFTAGGSSTANVDDGSLSTEWIDGMNRDADSIYIDLGGNFNICRIALTWDITGYAKDFDIKVSNDLVNWTIVKSFRGNTVTTTEFDGVASGRYVSMVGITRGTANPYSIFDFQVFGSPGSSCSAPTNLTAAPGSYTTIFTSQTPTGTPGMDGKRSVELGVKFHSSIAGFITGVRFYKTTGYTELILDDCIFYPGGQLATAVFTGETASGWQTVFVPHTGSYNSRDNICCGFLSILPHIMLQITMDCQSAITNCNLTAPANGGSIYLWRRTCVSNN